MKRLALIFCTLLLLTSCKAPEPVEPTAVPTVEPTPTSTMETAVSYPPEPLPSPVPEPTLKSNPEPTLEPTPTPEPEVPTLEEAKALVQQANTAMAHFVGEAPTEENTVDDWFLYLTDWKQMAGYTDSRQLLEELKAVFMDDMAEEFYDRYNRVTITTQKEKVYIDPDSRDILGFCYDMDLSTLEFSDEFYDPMEGGEQIRLTADGFGNGTPVCWNLRLAEENGVWQLCRYACYGVEDWRNERVCVLLDGQEYDFGSEGGPTWWKEPYQVVEEKKEKWGYARPCRTEYYPGLKVELHDTSGSSYDEKLTPLTITVTTPGIPTYQGIEVGMTQKEVLVAYPQFSLPGHQTWFFEEDYVLVYPTMADPEWGQYIYLHFDENQILEKMELGFNISN